MIPTPSHHLSRSALTAFIAVLALAMVSSAGSLTPSASPASTMHTLSEVYDSIASDSFDSSAISADQNGSLLANLKYINSQVVWASASGNTYSLGSNFVGIASTSPDSQLAVEGTAHFTGFTAIGSSSVPDWINSNLIDTTPARIQSITGFHTLNTFNTPIADLTYLILEPAAPDTPTYAKLNAVLTVTGAGNYDESDRHYASYNVAAHLGTGIAASQIGVYGAARSDSDGLSSGALRAGWFQSTYTGAGSTTAYGLLAAADHNGAGTVTTQYGGWFRSANNSTGVITSNYGIYVGTPGSQSITSNYGLYIDDQTDAQASNSYNIYSAGTGTRNYFAGHASVSGNFEISGTASVSSTLFLPGLAASDADDVYICRDPTTNALTTGATCTASSARFKENIEALTHGLDWVSQLRPVTFDWKHNGQPSLGFIAEEVASISTLLAIRQDGQIFSVNYQITTAVLTKAIQELASRQYALEGLLDADGAIPVESSGTFLDRIMNAIRDAVLRVRTLVADRVETDAFQMRDSATGDVYCVRITNGEWVKSPGECAGTQSAQTAAPAVSTPTPTPEPSPISQDTSAGTATPSPTPSPEPTEEPTPEPTPDTTPDSEAIEPEQTAEE